MKLAIFGAPGRTGRVLVQQALAEGYSVRALVRASSSVDFRDEQFELVQGDAMDAAAVSKTIEGSGAVLSTLGHTKASPKNIQSVATRHMVAAMRAQGVARIISLTGAGVRDPQDQPKLIDRLFGFLLATISRDVLRDAEEHAEVLRESGLAFTIVRGPRLTDGPHTGNYQIGYVGKDSGTQVSRADIAEFMIKQLNDDTWVRKAPMVSY